MINMSTVNSIRRQRREGFSISDIARMNGVSRDTVYKHLDQDDFSPAPPAKKSDPSKLDPYKPIIRQWMQDDARNWRKQRHTARRIWQRLVDECGADVSEATVGRYVAKLKRQDASRKGRHLDLVWEPGQAQADFGEADFYVSGVRTRLSFFIQESLPPPRVRDNVERGGQGLFRGPCTRNSPLALLYPRDLRTEGYASQVWKRFISKLG